MNSICKSKFTVHFMQINPILLTAVHGDGLKVDGIDRRSLFITPEEKEKEMERDVEKERNKLEALFTLKHTGCTFNHHMFFC